MPCTFKMVPLKMSILDIEGSNTYFFKVRLTDSSIIRTARSVCLGAHSEQQVRQCPHQTVRCCRAARQPSGRGIARERRSRRGDHEDLLREMQTLPIVDD